MELTFEEWLEINEEELSILFAETGADREPDFDIEAEELKLYESTYCKYLIKDQPCKQNTLCRNHLYLRDVTTKLRE